MTDVGLTLFGALKSSEGRRTGGGPRVPDVSTLPCPGGGLHVIVWRRGLMVCRGCGTSWAELDAAARAAVPVRKGRAA